MPNPSFVIKRTKKSREWYAIWVASNGKTVWKTSETYKRKAGVMKAINSLVAHGAIKKCKIVVQK